MNVNMNGHSCTECGQGGLFDNDNQECRQCETIHRMWDRRILMEKDIQKIWSSLEAVVKDAHDIKLVVMKTNHHADELEKLTGEYHDQHRVRMNKLEQHNIKIVHSVNDCVGSINLFGQVVKDLRPWRDGIGDAVRELKRKIRTRVKKTKFEGWKTKVKHHRQHLIVLTTTTSDVDI